MTSRDIPDPGFADDDGAPDPVLRAALDARAQGRVPATEVLGLLAGARLLVPVVAVLGEVEVDEAGLAHDKSSDMAAVLVTGADGRTALLAFTGADAMAAWDPQARPVPVTAATAATAALQEGAAALAVDLAGPAPYVLTGPDLEAVAAGWRLVRVDGRLAWVGASPDGPGDSPVPE
ncbi:SseB family protein [Nocardioides sp. AX2bis]|uniref:SseB family protein n=1 Tax=Nocardioides sp. AX2bis TaxID=2653157 RepID=UPI0012EF19E0|nr:SseB family protein [Nocardioides sp. AX2bis]VXB64339.1 conserved hypothetical protein [Nocardioides sp. AX2bis]